MARHFLRLKLALLGSGFRRNWQQAVGLIVGVMVALPLGAAVGVGVGILGRRGALGLGALGIGLTLLLVGWALIPLIAFGVDETLDPARLRLLPLTRRQLFVGLAVTSAVGVAPLATALALAGVVAGLAPAGPGALVVVLAVVGHFALCILASRALTTALASRLRSRRARDAVTFLFALLGVGVGLLGQLPRLLIEAAPDSDLLAALERWGERASLLPSGWAARAAVAGSRGAVLDGLAWVAGLAVLCALLGWGWMVALDRAAGQVEEGPGRGEDADLYPRLVRWLPHNRLGAAAARELRYGWRVPQLRIQWIFAVFVGVVAIGLTVFVDELDRPETVLAAALPAGLQGLSSLNLFGADRAVWQLVAAESAGWRDVAGKNLAATLVLLPLMVVTAVVLAALTGGWTLVPLAVAAGLALLAVSFGVGDLASVLAPQRLPDSVVNPFARASGVGCATALIQLVAVSAIGALLTPVALSVGLAAAFRPGMLPIAVTGGVLYGALILGLGLTLAGRRLHDHGPELITALGG